MYKNHRLLCWAALTVLCFSSGVRAQEMTIPAGTQWVKPIAGKVLGTQLRASSTEIALEFVLGGCEDRLLPLITRIERQHSQVRVYLTALNAHKGDSVIDCYMLPLVTKQVNISGRYSRQNIQVIFLGVDP
jgi:hypothetical protein